MSSRKIPTKLLLWIGVPLFLILWYDVSCRNYLEAGMVKTRTLYRSESNGLPISGYRDLVVSLLDKARARFGKVEEFELGSAGCDPGMGVWHVAIAVRRKNRWFREEVLGVPEIQGVSIMGPYETKHQAVFGPHPGGEAIRQ